MKKLILTSLMFLSLGFFSVANAQTETKTTGPKILFDKLENDFGDIQKGGNGECVFVFTNTGTEPLLLSNVSASCGCTTPSWTKDPIMPGKKGEIKVKYDTNRLGGFNKSVTVSSNAENGQQVLRIKGNVLEEKGTL